MTEREIRRMIRKLSRRRHRAMRSLLWRQEMRAGRRYSDTGKEHLRLQTQWRGYIEELDTEIWALYAKLK